MRDIDLPYGGLRGAREALRRNMPDIAMEALRRDESKIADECLSLCKDGMWVDAETRIDRWLRPKFWSLESCAKAYRKAMEVRS